MSFDQNDYWELNWNYREVCKVLEEKARTEAGLTDMSNLQ